jgi:hypothetical protein
VIIPLLSRAGVSSGIAGRGGHGREEYGVLPFIKSNDPMNRVLIVLDHDH